MKQLKIFIISVLVFFHTSNTFADLPEYDRDENFFHCLDITQDWSPCLKDNAQRVLKIIQQDYLTILRNPQLLSWNKTIDENTSVMKDMYESWTAYRNRWCALSVTSSKYNAPLFDPELSCMDYQNMRKEDYLKNIINMMAKKVPPKRADYAFMKIEDHDEDFNNCIKQQKTENKEQYKICIAEEIERTNKELKSAYTNFIEDDFIGKWNNAPTLKSGNYRDMFDSWIAYRNRLCSLITWSFKKTYGENEYSLNECILHLNKEKIQACKLLLQGAHTFLDDEVIYTDEDGNEKIVDVTENDDGGAADGAKIKPLSRRIYNKTDDAAGTISITSDERKKTEGSEEQTQKKKNLPSWAQ